MFERSAWWSEFFWPEPGVVMISTSSPWSLKKPSSRATSNGRSWIAFIIDALTFFMPASWRSGSVPELLPSPVVDGVLVRRAGHGHVPLHRPAIGVVPALARIGRDRSVQEPPVLEFLGLEEAAGLAHQVMHVRPRILLEHLDRTRLRAEHLLQRFGIRVVARRFGAGRVRLDENPHAPLLRDADPGLHQARRGDLAVAHGLEALQHRAGVGALEVLRLEEAFHRSEERRVGKECRSRRSDLIDGQETKSERDAHEVMMTS